MLLPKVDETAISPYGKKSEVYLPFFFFFTTREMTTSILKDTNKRNKKNADIKVLTR